MRTTASILALTALLAASTVTAKPASAAYSACGGSPNYYAQQYLGKNTYYGQFGYFNSNNINVAHPTSQFSLSHLYLGAASAGGAPPTVPEVEVGWFVGMGAGSHSTTSPQVFTAIYDDMGVFHEQDFAYLGAGSSHSYQLTYRGYDYNTSKQIWGTYFDGGLLVGWRLALPYGKPSAGGEAPRGDGAQMAVHGTSHQQLQTGDGQYHDWTPAYMSLQNDHTYACDDVGYDFHINSQFEDYVATGRA